MSLLLLFRALVVAGYALVLVAAARRHRLYLAFVAVILGVHTGAAAVMAGWMGPLLPAYLALHATVYVHFLCLARARMRSLPYRVFVSLPASGMAAATFFAVPFAIAVSLGASPAWLALPHLLGAVGLWQSLTARREVVELTLDGRHLPGPARAPGSSWRPARRAGAAPTEALRVVQITDPHLGPFMSVARLRRIAARAVERDPDLILLTGDFLTMESQGDSEHLARALEPLSVVAERVLACPGNHDHEAWQTVRRALERHGIRLLVDEAVVVPTRRGPVQVLGLDFLWKDRARRMAEAVARHPRLPGVPRLVLLHDPGAFRHLPEGEADLVLSGHTHGGQIGLLSLGLSATALRLFVDMPDHGFWARGRDRLYVHRGTGHYGFPLRLGVPAEESELWIRLPPAPVS